MQEVKVRVLLSQQFLLGQFFFEQKIENAFNIGFQREIEQVKCKAFSECLGRERPSDSTTVEYLVTTDCSGMALKQPT